MTDNQKEEIQKMRQEGKSYSQIAIIIGINKNTVKSYCRRNNLGATESNKPKNEKKVYTACKHCGKQLIQGTNGQPKKFCSEQCRRLWWKANDNQIVRKAYYTIRCLECGKKFESYGNKNRKFCGHACYINNRFKKERTLNDTRAI